MANTIAVSLLPSPAKPAIHRHRRRQLLHGLRSRRLNPQELRKACAGSLREKRKAREENFEQTVVRLLPLVKRTAQHMRDRLPAHVEMGDLVGAGALGLMDAVRKFNSSMHVKIESYARHRIRGAILDSLRTLDHASRDMRRKTKATERVHRDAEARLGQPVSDAEMADALGVSLSQWYRTVLELQGLGVDWLRPMGSAGTKQIPPVSSIADQHDDPFALCYRREQKEILKRALAGLPERDRLVMEFYYERGWTMKQIGARLGVDESRISQVHSATIHRLRASVNAILNPPPPRAQFCLATG